MTIEEAKKRIGIREEQIWLLKAALFEPTEAYPYWILWKKYWKLENIAKEEANYAIFIDVDSDSQRILPLVYRNLEHTQDPLLPALRDAYRNTWMRNQKLLGKAQQLIRAYNDAKIPAMLLKGIPMSLYYYKDMGVRPMGDIDVLVPVGYLEQAINILTAFGNTPDSIEYQYRHLIHAIHCFDKGGVDVDLHWQAFFFQAYSDKSILEQSIFRQALALTKDDKTFILSDSFQLFHTIIHGTVGGIPAFRWIADACTILKKSDEIDFETIFKYAEEHNVEVALHAGLQLLVEHFSFDFVYPPPVKNRYTQELLFKLHFKNPKNVLSKRIDNFILNILTYFLFVKPQSKEQNLSYWLYQKYRFSLATRSHNTTTMFFERWQKYRLGFYKGSPDL